MGSDYDHDDQYLFRLVSTFGWDDATSFCDRLVSDIECAAAASRRDGDIDIDIDDDDGPGADVTPFDDGDDDDDFDHVRIRGQRNRSSLRRSLRLANDQLYYRDQWGNTPLHAASYVKPPTDVVVGLFRVGRALRRRRTKRGDCQEGCDRRRIGGGGGGGGHHPPIWAMTSKDGSTPFLVACSTGASTSVLHAYLDEVEHYVERKWSNPRHSRMLVVRPDDQGTSPLSGWTSFHEPWIGRRKTSSSSSSSSRGSDFGAGPRRHSHHLVPRGMIGDAASSSSSSSSQCQPSEYWDFACRALVIAATTRARTRHPPHATHALVHRCAAIAGHCPVSLLEWIVAPPPRGAGDDDDDAGGCFPGNASAATADDLGRLPLHRALEATFDEDAMLDGCDFDDCAEDDSGTVTTSPIPPAEAEADASASVPIPETVRRREAGAALYGNPRLQRNRARIVETLLKWHPRAAAIPFPDGRSPLVRAIATGGSWHCADFYNGNVGLLQLLWAHSPELSLEIDPLSGLYPFMLAATVPVGRHSRNEYEVVENVYNLLRKDPQLVSRSLPAGDTV